MAAVVVGVVLRVVGLDRLSFWLDEAFSVWLAHQPIQAILSFSGDPHPSLYYVILHYWLAGGDSEAWTRFLSAVFGCLTIPLTYVTGRLFAGSRVGLLAAWLLAVSPWHIWYSQETRMYSVVCFLGMVSLLSGVLWLTGGTPLFAVAYVASALAGLYVDYTMFLVWPAEPLLLPSLLRGRPQRVGVAAWFLSQVAILVGYLPQLGLLEREAVQFLLYDRRVPSFGSPTRILLLAVALAIAGSALGLVLRRWSVPWRQVVAAALILVCLVSVAAIAATGAMTAKRALTVTVPLVCLGAAWAIAQSGWSKRLGTGLVAASLAAFALTVATAPKEQWREAVAQIRGASQPTDLVIIEEPWMTYPFDYYDRGKTARIGVSSSNPLTQLKARSSAPGRVWLIVSPLPSVDPTEQIAREVAARYTLQGEWNYFRVDVRLYVS